MCALFFGPAERDAILKAYLRAGLRAGDKCLCVVDGVEPAEMLSRIDPADDPEPGQFEVRRSAEVYLRAGGAFSPDQMIDYLGETIRTATHDDGYEFVRAAGDMTWALARPVGVEQLFDYESEINRFAPLYPQMLLCMYDLERFGGAILPDLLGTHPKILLGGMILDNPHYLSADEFQAVRS